MYFISQNIKYAAQLFQLSSKIQYLSTLKKKSLAIKKDKAVIGYITLGKFISLVNEFMLNSVTMFFV